ncbi:DUF1801 domain-containing protein [Haematomicrobium sanguinis]|uniref:DUF1801 domain-containing protein n=1 Tax=Haematomicrobium sanguinis TaxID=479106 RepID=UPI00047A5617|nr:DUF1801 domain-containing protein [Haematomicrobium sanguinis]
MAENVMQPTTADPGAFIAALENRTRQADAELLLEMMTSISGQPPVMWGSSIIGFGSFHYKYASGREGDTPMIAFAPRKAHLVLYISLRAEDNQKLLETLGKHKTSVACLYINKLADIDLPVLQKMVKNSFRAGNPYC